MSCKEGQLYRTVYGGHSLYKVVAVGTEYVTMQSQRKRSENVFETMTYDNLNEFWELEQ